MAAANWKPCQISVEALRCLKLASAVSGREMRDIASEAIVVFCKDLLQNADFRVVKKK